MDEDLHGDLSLLEEAKTEIEKNLEAYSKLADLTDQTYLYAQSMQTPRVRFRSKTEIPTDIGVRACRNTNGNTGTSAGIWRRRSRENIPRRGRRMENTVR